MPANKNQIRRMQTILSMLRQNRYPNFTRFLDEMKEKDAAGVFSLSSKTFSRDIADLRDEYGAPIQYNASKKGFYLTDNEWFDATLMIEPFEMRSFLLGEQVARNILPDPLRSEMIQAVSSLLMKNKTGMDAGVELENFQILNPRNLPQVDPEIFISCYNAWEQHKYLRLTYSPVGKASARKLFEPHIFAWNSGSWYIKGKIIKNNDTVYEEPLVQVLAIHRISQVEIIDSTFFPAPEILKEVRKSGLFDFQRIPEAVIEFFPPLIQPMEEKYKHIPDAVIEKTAESIKIRLTNITEFEAAQLVFNAIGNARVHAPEELRAYIRSVALKVEEYHQ